MEGPKPEKRRVAYEKWNRAQKDFEEAGGISDVLETVGNILDALPSRGLEFRKEQELHDLLMDLISASAAEAEKCARHNCNTDADTVGSDADSNVPAVNASVACSTRHLARRSSTLSESSTNRRFHMA